MKPIIHVPHVPFRFTSFTSRGPNEPKPSRWSAPRSQVWGLSSSYRSWPQSTDPATGAAVESLNPADVRVTEDGGVGKVLKVESVKQKVKVQVLLDTGLGIPAESVTQLRAAVRGLLEALPPGVEATLVTTSPQPRFLVRSTANREELLRGVERLAPDRGAGRFVESLAEGASAR